MQEIISVITNHELFCLYIGLNLIFILTFPELWMRLSDEEQTIDVISFKVGMIAIVFLVNIYLIGIMLGEKLM